MNRRESLWLISGGVAAGLAGTAGLGIETWALSRLAPRKKVGFRLEEWTSPSGHARKYLLFVPYDYESSTSFPLILFLNGFGENGTDGRMQLAENFGISIWQMKQRFPFIVVAPQCRPDGSWLPGSADLDAALAIVDDLSRELRFDESRVYLTGVSNGGEASWYVAAKYATRFAAVVPIASPGPRNGDRRLCESLAAANVPIWAFYNRFDHVAGVVPFNRAMQRDLLELGQSPIFTEYPQKLHDSWDRAYSTPALYQWLLRQRLSRGQRPQQRFSVFTINEFARFGKHGALGAWASSEDHGVICTPAAVNSDCYLLSAEPTPKFDLHCEVQLQDDSSLGFVLRASPQTDGRVEGWKLVLRRPDQGCSGITSLDERKWFTMCDPLSQTQLLANVWNEIRIECSDTRISVVINGFAALDAVPTRGLNSPGRFGLAVTAERPGIQGKWRRLRFRI
jgi:pimeloyl-ACP methyl ester carboxylesterase